METKKQYSYSGPVTSFDRQIMSHWEAQTYAVSPKKAKSNLVYRFKREYNLEPGSKVELPGTITEEV